MAMIRKAPKTRPLAIKGNQDAIIEYTRARVERAKEAKPLDVVADSAKRTVSTVVATGACTGFREALEARGLSVIGEVLMGPEAVAVPFDELATDYEWADAAAIAFPTEPRWLDGGDTRFLAMRDEVCTPMLRRDFVVDPYQVYEAKYMGADAFVLDITLLDDATLKECLDIAQELLIDAMVEVNDAAELARALNAGATIIGIELADFKKLEAKMAEVAPGMPLVPEGCLLVIGPDIDSMEDAQYARQHGADGVLVGKMFLGIADQDERQDAIRTLTEID